MEYQIQNFVTIEKIYDLLGILSISKWKKKNNLDLLKLSATQH